MGKIIEVITFIFTQFGKLLELIISLPTLLFATVASFVQSVLLVVNGFDSIVSTVTTYLQQMMISVSEFTSVLSTSWFSVGSYVLALDRLLEGALIVVGIFLFLELVLAVVIVEYFLPACGLIIMNKISLKFAKALMPNSWSPHFEIDCPDLLQIELKE